MRERDQPLAVLIGGATGVGKTTVAHALADKLGIVHVATTDSVREILRWALQDLRDSPVHVSSFEAAVAADRPAGDDDPLIAGFIQQAGLVLGGVGALLRRAAVEARDTIIEGVHLVPGELQPLTDSGTIVVPLVVAVDDVDAHRSYLVARSREASQRPADRYLSRFGEIRRIHDELGRRAHQFGVPTVHSTDLEQTVAEAMQSIEQARDQ